MTAAAAPPRLTGILFALGGSSVLSVNDLAIKSLSGDYALHQVILFRALIGLVFLLIVVGASGTGYAQLRTRRWRAHLLRVSVVMVSNVTYFLGLAALPIADAVATAYVSPVLVTLLSILVLREKVGPWRWAGVAAGLIGVLVMMRPGAGVFQWATVLVLISALCYASSHMMTRYLRGTESAFTLNFYVQIGFILVSSTMGLTVGDGHLAAADGAALEFLFRLWVWPPVADWPWFLATGLSVSIGGLMVSQAYRTTEAAIVAPFEYAAMPLAIFWGAVVFHTWPDGTAWAGIALICGAGLWTLWREAVREKDRHETRSGDL